MLRRLCGLSSRLHAPVRSLPLLARPSHPLTSRRWITDITAKDVLAKGEANRHAFSIDEEMTVMDAAHHLMEHHVSCVVAVKGDHVTGLLSERDIVKALRRHYAPDQPAHIAPGWENTRVRDVMTPAKEMIYAKPTDTSMRCLSLMYKTRLRHLPVINRTSLLGILSFRNIVAASPSFAAAMEEYDQGRTGSKGAFLHEIKPRKGLPAHTAIDASAQVPRLYLAAASSAHPHPKKKATGGEDAALTFVRLPHTQTPVSMLGVFDGVGSWSFEQGIDAARFSRTLATSALEYLQKNVQPSAMDVLQHSWDSIVKQKIVGGSTACLIGLEGNEGHINSLNLGDSGFVLFRPNKERGGYEVSNRSMPQMHYFNCPYQLGLSPEAKADWEQPPNAHMSDFPVHAGDIIVLSTDGLFDNMSEEEITDVVNETLGPTSGNTWSETYNPHLDHGATVDNEKIILGQIGPWTSPPAIGPPDMRKLASALADRALLHSLNREKEGPFAVLAKDNGILWKYGGRPDDITVVAARVALVPAVN